MNTYQVLNLFARQIERSTNEKVIVTPSSVKERGVVIKASLLKTWLPSVPKGTYGTRTVRIRLSVCGTAESHTGLLLAVAAIEKLDRHLIQSPKGSRLQDQDGKTIPNTRIVTVISEEDSFFDSPDSVAVQDVQDDRICIITFPWEEEENEERSEVRNEERADSEEDRNP